MIDRTLVAKAIADVRDAVARIREVLPPDEATFLGDRTAREVVVLHLFVALQHGLSLGAHLLADAGRDVPGDYREVFRALGERSLVPAELAARLGSAAGLRNLIAQRYGVIDWRRIHAIAASQLQDLLDFCGHVARVAERGSWPATLPPSLATATTTPR